MSTGSETSLASDISHKLATDDIYSKVVSMPCHKLFDQQSEGYKNKILNETNLVVSMKLLKQILEKYTGNKGLNFESMILVKVPHIKKYTIILV